MKKIKKCQLGDLFKLRNRFQSSEPAHNGGTPFKVIVTGKRKKNKPYQWVSARTPQLTAGDAAKAWDTMVTPALSWALPNIFKGIDAAQRGDIDGVALEGLKAFGLKGVGALASNTTRAGMSNGLNAVRTALTNPVATSKAAGTAVGNTLKNIFTPGSTFWTNPLTRRTAYSLAAGEGANKALEYTTGKNWGENVSELIHNTTGWNPRSSVTGTLLTDLSNPYFLTPSRAVEGIASGIGKTVENGAKGIDYLVRMDMPRFGYRPSTNYYFKPEYARMNWFGINRRNPVVQQTPRTDPRTLITDANEKFGSSYKQITLENLQKLAEERIGRRLLDTELEDYIGKGLFNDELGFAPALNRYEKEPYFVFEEANLPEILSNFDRFTSQNTIRTRMGNDRYSLQDVQGMIDDQGNLGHNVALQRVYPGNHGKANWNLRGDSNFEKVQKYFRTKYNTGAQIGILRDNPFDRSGVLVKGGDGDYSIDSFMTALQYLNRSLGKYGKKFFELKKPVKKFRNGDVRVMNTIGANDLGQRGRYEEIDFDPDFVELLKANKGELPKSAQVFMNDKGNLRIQYDKRKVGTLRPRDFQEITGYGSGADRVPGDYDKLIDDLNKNYNLNIGYPTINSRGGIDFPNIYGILYNKKGGNINVPKNIQLYRRKPRITK